MNDPIDPFSLSRIGRPTVDRRSAVTLSRALYESDFGTTFAEFQSRFKSGDVGSGKGIAQRDFQLINALRPAIDRMVEAMPGWFDVRPDRTKAPAPAAETGENEATGDADGEHPEPKKPAEAKPTAPAKPEPKEKEPAAGDEQDRDEDAEEPTAQDQAEAAKENDPLEIQSAEITKWLNGPYAGRGRSFYSVWPSILQRQVVDGYLPVCLYKVDIAPKGPGQPFEEVEIRIRDSAQMTYEANPTTGELEMVQFEWSFAQASKDGGEAKTVNMIEQFDRQKRVLYDGSGSPPQQWTHGLGEVPVVLIPRRDAEDTLLSASAVELAREAYLSFLHAWYLLAIANKYEAFGVYCQHPQDEDDFMGGGETTTGQDVVAIFPGCFVKRPIDKVGGSINTDTLQAGIALTLEALHNILKVHLNSQQTADMRSGKAKLIDSEQMKADVDVRCRILKDRIRQILEIRERLLGRPVPADGLPICVEFPSDEQADAQINLDFAKLALDAAKAGKLNDEQLHVLWQRFTVWDEDADPKVIAADAKAASEAAAQAETDRLIATMMSKDQPAPGEPGEKPNGQVPADE